MRLEQRVKTVEEMLETMGEQMDRLKRAVFGDVLATIQLYPLQQSAWTMAPNPEAEIGTFGDAGQLGPGSVALDQGLYAVTETYELPAADHGTVRWIKLRCGPGDPTQTQDGVAWMPCRPWLIDCGALYEQLGEKPDGLTQKFWDDNA